MEPPRLSLVLATRKVVLRMVKDAVLFRDQHAVVHECEGMHEPDGHATAWSLCDGKAAHNFFAGDPMTVTCRPCRQCGLRLDTPSTRYRVGPS